MPQIMNGKGRQEACDLALWRLHAVETEVGIGRDLLQGSLQQLLLWTPVSQVVGCRAKERARETLAVKNFDEIQSTLEIKDHDMLFLDY